jgi:hypothetical protein
MAAFALTAQTILLGTAWTGTAPGSPGTQTIAGTITTASDISGFCRSVGEPGWNTNMLDVTTYASGGYEAVIAGLTKGKEIQIDANADLAASQLHAILFTTLGGPSRAGSSPVYLDIKATSAARSATNPSFVAAVFIPDITSFAGGAGERAVSSFTLRPTGAFGFLAS